MRRPLLLGVIFSAACASLAVLSAQDGELRVPPIPAVERFIPGTGLRVRLTVDHSSVAAFENPGFRAVFENVGHTTLYLNPGVASNVYLYDEAGQPVPAVSGYVAETILRVLKQKELVLLKPRRTWTVALTAEHHDSLDVGRGSRYTTGRDSQRMPLRAGRYTARFEYVNEPGFPSSYDLAELRDIWEGRLTSEPVAFTVAAGAETEAGAVDRFPATVDTSRSFTSIADAEDALGSGDEHTVSAAASYLSKRLSSSSIPRLLSLLNDRRPLARRAALLAVLAFDGDESHATALAAADDEDVNFVRRPARDWLVAHCRKRDLKLIEGWFAPSSVEWADAVGRCGEAEDFLRLRAWSTSEAAAREPRRAFLPLTWLTFFGYTGCTNTGWPTTLTDWDAWYRRHRNESRAQWAIASARARCSGSGEGGSYLRRADGLSIELLREAASAASPGLRIGAAVAIARERPAEAIALLRRDIMNRLPGVCALAIAELNRVTHKNLEFDCHVPADRDRASEAFR